MSCGSGMHSKIIYRSSANVGMTKALDRVLARIAREEPTTPTDPAPGDGVAPAERDQVEPGEPSEANE